MNDKQRLYSLHKRIKNNCCQQWRIDSKSFYTWYKDKVKEQKELCHYCHLRGNTKEIYGRHFRNGRRGFNLEVDRKDAKGLYSPENCVLACYPCNNVKSDVFSYDEFLEIGKVISKVKKRTN
ncbi:hypothetical protein ES707_04848 [subsurface metagenome]